MKPAYRNILSLVLTIACVIIGYGFYKMNHNDWLSGVFITLGLLGIDNHHPSPAVRADVSANHRGPRRRDEGIGEKSMTQTIIRGYKALLDEANAQI
ncbi:MAG: hypothetical protein EOO46_24190, partial [Flavobacterium sp.]